MSQILGTQVKKFTKWLIVRKEIKFNRVLEILNKECPDYNQTVAQLAKQNADWLDKLHARHQITMMLVLTISAISAISGVIVTILGL